MMDWSNIETVKVLYRLLAVKGMGPVRANNLLSNLRTIVVFMDVRESYTFP